MKFANLIDVKAESALAAMSISVTPLGAGQDVGRSCLLVNIGGKRVMLDCGMHMGYQVRTCTCNCKGTNLNAKKRYFVILLLSSSSNVTLQDDRRFPDFNFIAVDEPLTEHIDAVIIRYIIIAKSCILPPFS